MVCPQCNDTFEQRLQCPACGVRLLYQAQLPRRGGSVASPGSAWQQTPWGRIIIGLLLSQGLYYGFRNLCMAGLLVAGEGAPRDVWTTLTGLILLQALQAVGVLIAGALAGAGQRQGFIYGSLVGVWNGALFIVAQNWTGDQEFTAVALFGLPILQTAFGALGGFVGSCIWKPLASLTVISPPRTPFPLGTSRRKQSAFSGPIAWGRVVTGTTVAVGGCIWANVILDYVLEAAEGKLSISSHLQAQLVTWEITALAMLVGGVLAGSATSNGIKQGFCVALGTSAVLLGVHLASANLSLQTMISTLGCSVSFGLVGGWFGSQMLPPLVPARVRKRFSGATL